MYCTCVLLKEGTDWVGLCFLLTAIKLEQAWHLLEQFCLQGVCSFCMTGRYIGLHSLVLCLNAVVCRVVAFLLSVWNSILDSLCVYGNPLYVVLVLTWTDVREISISTRHVQELQFIQKFLGDLPKYLELGFFYVALNCRGFFCNREISGLSSLPNM